MFPQAAAPPAEQSGQPVQFVIMARASAHDIADKRKRKFIIRGASYIVALAVPALHDEHIAILDAKAHVVVEIHPMSITAWKVLSIDGGELPIRRLVLPQRRILSVIPINIVRPRTGARSVRCA